MEGEENKLESINLRSINIDEWGTNDYVDLSLTSTCNRNLKGSETLGQVFTSS